jgi:hypothetical protein
MAQFGAPSAASGMDVIGSVRGSFENVSGGSAVR